MLLTDVSDVMVLNDLAFTGRTPGMVSLGEMMRLGSVIGYYVLGVALVLKETNDVFPPEEATCNRKNVWWILCHR